MPGVSQYHSYLVVGFVWIVALYQFPLYFGMHTSVIKVCETHVSAHVEQDRMLRRE
jgi:hypothetical protein